MYDHTFSMGLASGDIAGHSIVVTLFSSFHALHSLLRCLDPDQKYLLKSAEKFFGSDRISWVLQKDNDPKHRSKLCKAWKDENNVTTMEWPAMFPDANSIENVWSYMKMKLKRKSVYTMKQLSIQIKKIWRSLPNEYAEKFESMEKRCQAIISNGGDWTRY